MMNLRDKYLIFIGELKLLYPYHKINSNFAEASFVALKKTLENFEDSHFSELRDKLVLERKWFPSIQEINECALKISKRIVVIGNNFKKETKSIDEFDVISAQNAKGILFPILMRKFEEPGVIELLNDFDVMFSGLSKADFCLFEKELENINRSSDIINYFSRLRASINRPSNTDSVDQETATRFVRIFRRIRNKDLPKLVVK